MAVINSSRTKIEGLGWRALDERVWDRLNDFRHGLVILAPPLDTIPSPYGNAIYTLVEEVISHLSVPALLLARWPAQGSPQKCAVSDRILYDTRPMKPGWLESHLPYRLKRLLTGSGAPYYYGYARRAAQLCQLLLAERIVVEDIPVFSLPIRKQNPKACIYLHQHNNAPKSVPFHHWRRVVSGLNGVVFVAEETRRFTEYSHGKLTIPSYVVYNGVDLSHFDPTRWHSEGMLIREALGILPHEKVLLFVGRIIPHKGVAEAAEAFHMAALTDSHLVIVGSLDSSLYSDAAYTQRLRRVAEESGGKIHLVGPKPPSKMPAYYTTADVVIIPSVGREGLPKVITEALAMGKPCLVSNRGGAVEVIQEQINGWIIPDPQDLPDLAARISSALSQSREIQVERSLVDIQRMAMEFQLAIGLNQA